MIRVHRRHFLLIEVLIAFALVVLCIFPLVSAHMSIYKAQMTMNQKIELDQNVSRLYGVILERLYRNEVDWSAILEEQSHAVDPSLLQAAGIEEPFPFLGNYQFKIVKQKTNETSGLQANLVSVMFTFKDSRSTPLTFIYRVCIKKEGTSQEKKA